jgi:hypothetical protein
MHEYYILSATAGWLPTPFLAPTRWQAIMLAVASGLRVKGVSYRSHKS